MFLMRESYHAGRKHVIDNANDKAIYMMYGKKKEENITD
jgi:hypothetical protein